MTRRSRESRQNKLRCKRLGHAWTADGMGGDKAASRVDYFERCTRCNKRRVGLSVRGEPASVTRLDIG